mmetsp:Transcript_883/g.986  ORF Transcript_883/g.986 Transcript_883/m.986 type:complete len:87 (-) Transcript_883:564-824(-)
MPNGIRNIFAIECSRPKATKAEIGNQMATILEIKEVHPDAMYTAMHTSQLHSTPRMNRVPKFEDNLRLLKLIAAAPTPKVFPLKTR